MVPCCGCPPSLYLFLHSTCCDDVVDVLVIMMILMIDSRDGIKMISYLDED